MTEIGIGSLGTSSWGGRIRMRIARLRTSSTSIHSRGWWPSAAGMKPGCRRPREKLGWEGYETDYHELVARPDIQLVDVSTPGDTHNEIVLAALAAGKHVLCEKPLANNLAEAREMLDAARRAGVIAIVNFNYRRVPAVQFAKKLIDDGAIGEVRHWRAVYLQDWINDPNFPLVWRLQKELAGSGALGDIAAHITDLGLYLVGPIAEVVGTMSTFIKERPVATESGGGAGSDRGVGHGDGRGDGR